MRRLVLAFALIACESKKEASPASASTSSSPAATSASRERSSCGDEVVTDEGIGHLRIGASVDSLGPKCKIVRDTTVIASEGMPARMVFVAFSEDTVEAEIVDGQVWRIAVHSPRLRTAESLGVGTLVARLLRLRNPRGMAGEGKFFIASPEHCGMSFRLANAGPGAQRGDLDRAGLARLSATAVVSEVLIFGCRIGSGQSN